MKRCANPACGRIEELPDARYCALCGGRLVDAAEPAGREGLGGAGHEVYLVSPGKNIIDVIKVIRQYTELGLKEAKDLADSAPGTIWVGIVEDVAGNMKRDLEQAGARADVRVAAAIGEIPRDSDNGDDRPDFAVILNDPGSGKIGVIKVVREHTNLGLKQAKELVESVPGSVCAGLTREEAERLKEDLDAAGAAAEVRSGYSGYGRGQGEPSARATGKTYWTLAGRERARRGGPDARASMDRDYRAAPIEPGQSRTASRSCVGLLASLFGLLMALIALVWATLPV